jgi:pimeloyl-ACP methyl ester carboxylesterase
LKGVVPPSGTMPLRHAPDGQEALDAVLARCRADQSCHSAFPHLRRALYALLDQLRATPRRAAIKASDGQDREVLITAGLFGEALRNMLYTPETIARVPLILTNAARGDMSELATIVDRTKAVLNGAISVGMFLSVTCTEDVPFIEEHRIEMAAVFGDFRIRQQQQACSVWTRGTVPADFRSPVHSDRPALLISGELDPATPPRSAAEVARGLPNSLQVVVRHNGHPMGALQPCASKMIAVLTREGTTKGLDTSCAQMLTLAPFAMPPRLDRLQSQQPAAQQRVSGLLRSSETSLSVRSLDSSS